MVYLLNMVIFHGYVSHNKMVYRVALETGFPNWASQIPCYQPVQHRWTAQLLLLFQLIESRNDEPSALILGRCCSPPPLNADKRQQAPYGFVWKLAACNPNSIPMVPSVKWLLWGLQPSTISRSDSTAADQVFLICRWWILLVEPPSWCKRLTRYMASFAFVE